MSKDPQYIWEDGFPDREGDDEDDTYETLVDCTDEDQIMYDLDENEPREEVSDDDDVEEYPINP